MRGKGSSTLSGSQASVTGLCSQGGTVGLREGRKSRSHGEGVESLRPPFTARLPLFHLFLFSFTLCLPANFPLFSPSSRSHTVALSCSIVLTFPCREVEFANCSETPTTLSLSFAFHPSCLTLNIPRSIFKMLSLLFALALSS